MKEIIDYLDSNYTEQRVAEMFDEELLNWVDSDWADTHECEYDWYIDHNNGEAQDAVVNQIVGDLKANGIVIQEEIDMNDLLKDKYPVIS